MSNALPKGVARLLNVVKGEMSVLDMMMALKLGGRRNFLEKYLTPSIELGLVESLGRKVKALAVFRIGACWRMPSRTTRPPRRRESASNW